MSRQTLALAERGFTAWQHGGFQTIEAIVRSVGGRVDVWVDPGLR